MRNKSLTPSPRVERKAARQNLSATADCRTPTAPDSPKPSRSTPHWPEWRTKPELERRVKTPAQVQNGSAILAALCSALSGGSERTRETLSCHTPSRMPSSTSSELRLSSLAGSRTSDPNDISGKDVTVSHILQWSSVAAMWPKCRGCRKRYTRVPPMREQEPARGTCPAQTSAKSFFSCGLPLPA